MAKALHVILFCFMTFGVVIIEATSANMETMASIRREKLSAKKPSLTALNSRKLKNFQSSITCSAFTECRKNGCPETCSCDEDSDVCDEERIDCYSYHNCLTDKCPDICECNEFTGDCFVDDCGYFDCLVYECPEPCLCDETKVGMPCFEPTAPQGM